MSNALFYTLSTIAQTLAGTLAILLALVLFGFSRVTDAIHAGPAQPGYHLALRVRSRLQWAIGLSLIDIGLCFTALPFTPVVAPNCGLAIAVLVVIVGLSVVCLLLYWRLINTLSALV